MVSRAVKPPPLGRVRLARIDDAPHILDLLTESISKNFRVVCTYDIIYLM